MSRFAPESLEALRHRVDLVEVLSTHVELKRIGSTYKGLCPFHDEKTPSFIVRPGDTHYHCFGCGAHGDAITFLMEQLQMNFSQAVEALANQFGVMLRRAEGERARSDSKKRQLREALRDAARFYHYALVNFAEAESALQYLFLRGIDLAFIRRFQLGFAPSQAGFQSVMHELGHKPAILQEAGLVNERGRDFFFNRILFPIREGGGHVVGFSGRLYKESAKGGKYINTPETPLFHKSDLLFGLHDTRRQLVKERRAILVEGQIDCLRLIHGGLDRAVAPLGTALTPAQAQHFVQLGVRDVTIAFDADPAGDEAAVKAGHLLQAAGVGVRVGALPKGMDPDALFIKEGPEAMMRIEAEARDYVSFLVGHLAQTIDIRSPSGKAEMVREVSKRVEEWKDTVVIHESLRKLAKILELPEEMVGVGHRPFAQTFTPMFTQVRALPTTRAKTDAVTQWDALEDDVIRWLVLMGEERGELMEIAAQHLTMEHFRTSSCREIFAKYGELHASNSPRDLITVAMQLEEQEALARILERRVNRERVQTHFCDAVQRLLERAWMERREAIRQKIQGGDLSAEAVMELVKEFEEVKRQRPVVTWPS